MNKNHLNNININNNNIDNNITDEERLEMGTLTNLKSSLHNRPRDDELRILIFTACYFVLDGVTLTIRRLESHLRSRGAVVKIASTVPDEFTAEQTKDVIIIPGIKIPFTQAGAGYAFGGSLGVNTIKEIEEFNPNCVHFTVPDLVSLDGIRWCQKNNIPYMATWHSNYTDYLKYYCLEWILKPGFMVYLQGFYEQMPAVYVPTTYMVNKLKKEGYGKNVELIEWGRGVDLKLFTPDRRSNSFRLARGIADHEVVVLWVGRLVPEKRVDIWMNVLQRLESEGIPARGMVVGHGTFESTLSHMKTVSCCGWLSGVALAEAYASADILLFPSDVETFGNVTLEALASGCVCVVVDDCSGHLVENGYNGYTCRPGDLEGFYQATKTLVQNNDLRTEMSLNARKSSWKYERNKILQQMAENYKDAIIRHRDPNYVKHLMSTAHGQGRTFLSILCCNYSLVKTWAEPFLHGVAGVQTLAESTKECLNEPKSFIPCNNGNNNNINNINNNSPTTNINNTTNTMINNNNSNNNSNNINNNNNTYITLNSNNVNNSSTERDYVNFSNESVSLISTSFGAVNVPPDNLFTSSISRASILESNNNNTSNNINNINNTNKNILTYNNNNNNINSNNNSNNPLNPSTNNPINSNLSMNSNDYHSTTLPTQVDSNYNNSNNNNNNMISSTSSMSS